MYIDCVTAHGVYLCLLVSFTARGSSRVTDKLSYAAYDRHANLITHAL